jgi:hypothetical protein
LLEILLALALTGLVLVSLNTFIFSMGELWGRGGEARLLDRHVQAFTRFLEEDLRGAEAGTVSAREMRTATGGREWVVSYLRAEGNRVMVWPERPLPDVLAGLWLREGQGLWLLFYCLGPFRRAIIGIHIVAIVLAERQHQFHIVLGGFIQHGNTDRRGWLTV